MIGERIDSPFPPWIAFRALVRGDLEGTEPDPAETALLSPRTVAKRRQEFLLGRLAARRALESLGAPRGPLLTGEQGEPLWPPGIVGSLSHVEGCAVAAVGRVSETAGIGVDLERPRGLSVDIADRVADPEERAWVEAEPAERDGRLIRLFSAKECVYKAFHRHRRTYFGFAAVTLRVLPGGGFRATLREALGDGYPAGYRFSIGCTELPGLVFSHLWLPPGSGSHAGA